MDTGRTCWTATSEIKNFYYSELHFHLCYSPCLTSPTEDDAGGPKWCMCAHWVALQEKNFGFEDLLFLLWAKASLLFVQRKVLPHPSRMFAAKTTLRDNPDKELSGPCIFEIFRKNVQECSVTMADASPNRQPHVTGSPISLPLY